MNLINVVKRQNQPTRLFIQWLFGLAVVAVLVFVFSKLAEVVWFREGFSWDAPIILAIHQFSNPILDAFMRFVTQTGETGAITIAIILVGWFVWKHRTVEAASVLIALGGAVTINTLLKLLFARPRPHLFPPLVVESGFSFPSGHVTASVAVYGFLAILLWQNKQRVWALLSGAWIIMVSISRIYLGVHYPSDTIAAIAFASLWLIVVVYVQSAYLKSMNQSTP
jgi:membrane-associated phospholipid phosphatase